jgi:hypothetical protein
MTENTPGHVHRRTVVAGAAWTIPVVATAIATPALAASGAPTLSFVTGPYTSAACSGVSTVVLQLTTDGTTPDPGKTVMVSLPNGLTWSDGTTAPRPFTTGTDGRATVTGLKAPGKNGTYALGASSGSLTATSSVAVTGQKSTVYANSQPIGTLPDNVVAVDVQTVVHTDGSTIVTVLGSNGRVYQKNSAPDGTTFPATWQNYSTAGVTDFALTQSGTGTRIAYAAGTTVYANAASIGALPNGATAVDVQTTNLPDGTMVVTVLASNGRIYQKNSATDGVTFPAPWDSYANTGITDFSLTQNGTGTRIAYTSGTNVYANAAYIGSLPNGATPVDVQTTNLPDGTMVVTVLASNGRVYQKNSATDGVTFPEPWDSYATTGVTDFALSALGAGTRIAYAAGTTVYANAASIGALPNGATAVDVQTTSQPDGEMVVTVLGSDGRVYQKNSETDGTTFPATWITYPTRAVTDVALSQNDSGYTRIAYAANQC